MKRENFYVYIMASTSGTIYTGMTNSIVRRVYEHKNKISEGFTKRYSCNKLVYYEYFSSVLSCIQREKQIKKMSRRKKELLIKSINPHWNDLYDNFFK